MAHRRLVLPMPAPADVVFDAFHYHHWKQQWDSLVRGTHVQGDAPCPYVGAVSSNAGAGLFRGLTMQTEFVSYDRPHLAAAAMRGRSFPFARWAASMRHIPTGDGRSTLVYTYTLETWPPGARWLMEPVVDRVFLRATRTRFRRLTLWLAQHADDVVRWQRERDAAA